MTKRQTTKRTGSATKPQWVDDCVAEYKRKGFSDEEANQRCYGAYNKRKAVAAMRSRGAKAYGWVEIPNMTQSLEQWLRRVVSGSASSPLEFREDLGLAERNAAQIGARLNDLGDALRRANSPEYRKVMIRARVILKYADALRSLLGDMKRGRASVEQVQQKAKVFAARLLKHAKEASIISRSASGLM